MVLKRFMNPNARVALSSKPELMFDSYSSMYNASKINLTSQDYALVVGRKHHMFLVVVGPHHGWIHRDFIVKAF